MNKYYSGTEIREPKPGELEPEALTKKRFETWDRVKCARCGKTISMLFSRAIRNGEAFVCQDGC